jgi:hypothetical protein
MLETLQYIRGLFQNAEVIATLNSTCENLKTIIKQCIDICTQWLLSKGDQKLLTIRRLLTEWFECHIYKQDQLSSMEWHVRVMSDESGKSSRSGWTRQPGRTYQYRTASCEWGLQITQVKAKKLRYALEFTICIYCICVRDFLHPTGPGVHLQRTRLIH